MTYSILTEARIQGSLADQQPESRGYSTFWPENGNLEDWTTFVDLDIVGVWNGFLFGTKRSATEGFIGPSTPFPAVDSFVNDRIFFRLKYDKHPKNKALTSLGKIRWTTVSDPLFDDTKSVTFDLISDQKWNFYEINVGDVGSWIGEINNIQFFPSIDGAFNDEFFLNFFEIGTNDFDFSFDNPKAGTPGKLTGGSPVVGEIIIEKDINDKLIVNIDGFGDTQITLTPQTAKPLIIARDVSLQLGKISIGGYLRAEAFIDIQSQKLIIQSGIRASDSTVRVKFGSQSAAPTLGLTDTVGNFIGTTEDGTDPDSDFVPLSSYSPTTLEILAMFDNDNTLPAFTLDPQRPVIEAGRSDFALVNRKLKTSIVIEGFVGLLAPKIETIGTLDFQTKTLIDLNHPFTDSGSLKKIFANGVFDSGGASKWKIFRPNLAGQLTLVNEGSIGGKTIVDDPSGGLVNSPIQDMVSADVSASNVNVRAGDLLGMFNASLHAGQGGTSKVDAMYYAIDGDVKGTITPPTPAGAGEAGLALYAIGKTTKSRSVIDIDLGRRLNLDKITVTGDEDSRDLEYNLGLASSASYSADTSGEHTVCFTENFERVCVTRTNAAFNLQALNDGIVIAENGISAFGDGGPSGLGGATAEGATYFYVNGDSEFFGTFEFVDQGGEAFDFIRDPIGLDVFFSSSTPRLDKPIGKAVMHFKEKRNQRVFQIEFSVGTGGGNGSKQGFSLVPEETISLVKIDTKEIKALDGNFITQKIESSLSDVLLRNPVELDVIAGGIRNPQKGIDFEEAVDELGGTNFKEQITFLESQWNRFEWNFDTLRTDGFRWFCDLHFSTKITEFEVFGVSKSNESLGDNVQILFSSTGTSFTTAELVTANEKQAEYKIGNSPQFLRVIVRPTLTTSINDLKVFFEEDQVCFGEEGRILGNVSIEDARKGVVGEATSVLITNNTGQTADLILDIPSDIQTSKQLLYFSKLHSEADIKEPQVGPPGRIDFESDKILKETENVAINARSYGLLSLARGTESNFSNSLLVNPGFEAGDLTGWNLTVTQSGTKSFQSPRVLDISAGTENESTLPSFQIENFVFGFEMDNEIPITLDQFTPVHFTLDQTIDISAFADDVDTGFVNTTLALRHRTYYNPESTGGPIVRVIGAPTLSGVNEPVGTTISGFGNNLLRTSVLFQPDSVGASEVNSIIDDIQASVVSGTRFLKLQFDIAADSERSSGLIKRMKFLLDEIDFKLKIPETTGARWYKAWRNSIGSTTKEFEGFTDASFVDVKARDFVTTIGSTHWFQPFNGLTTSTGLPESGQNQGFSNAFLQDRTKGIQSFRRMITTDPGILGAQWEGERDIAGLRLAFSHNTGLSATSSDAYPRHFHLEVLKTRDELGGITPDINNLAHAKIVRAYESQGPFATPDSITATTATFEAPISIVTTWLFEDGPVSTEGIKIIFTRNCDRFEVEVFDPTPDLGAINSSVTGADFTAFTNETTCPSNVTAGVFTSFRGIGISFFVPLEAGNISTLPLHNVKEHNESNVNIFAAVDLGRVHDIDTQSDLFELVATTVDQTQWIADTATFSDTNTDDPNLVQWDGGSGKARWIRFSCPAVDEFEPEDQLFDGTNVPADEGRVSSIPQSTLTQARIYPKIQTTLFPTIGYNSSWQDIGDTLSDNRNDTLVFYSDFPVVAVDLGKPYLLNNDSTVFRKNHTFSTPSAVTFTDKLFWNQDGEDDFAYSTKAFKGVTAPERVEFSDYGAGVPDIAIQWVAFKGTTNLQIGNTGPKEFLFQTTGQTLFEFAFRPRNEEVLTENPNWFTTNKAVLKDISSLKFTKGLPFSVVDGVDFGSNNDNLGITLNAFDGSFDEVAFDIWGVAVRDTERIVTLNSIGGAAAGLTRTFLDNPNLDFPHFIWRVFRDLYRGEILTKSVKAITILGADADFHPKSFIIQKLRTGQDPNLDASWLDIDNATFTDVNSFQDGAGFTHIFVEPVSTTGIRVFITDSEFPDDTVLTEISSEGTESFSTVQDVSGPQTRVAAITIFEEEIDQTSLVGIIENNHALGATFSSLTETPGHAVGFLGDGNINTSWQSTGFTDTVTITLPRKTTINKFEWEQDENIGNQTGGRSAGAPENFTVQANIAGVPTTIISDTVISGSSFTTDINPPVFSDTFTFDITSVQGELEDASGIILSEVRLIEKLVQTTPLLTFEEVPDRRPEGINKISTKVTYAANSDVIVAALMSGIDAGNDELWSQRDFFVFWLKINDINLFDTTFGSIKLGNDSTIAYRWNIADLNLATGWNKIRLQFRTAPDITPIELQISNLDPDTGESQVDFVTADTEVSSFEDGVSSFRIVQAPGIRTFEFEFRGVKGADELELTFDDMRFERNKFDDVVKFEPSLYLNNSEFFLINLNGIDLAAGTVEFWMSPDWTVGGVTRKGTTIIPALFRMIRPDGKFLNLFYRPNVGFVVNLFDGEKLLNFISNVDLFLFERFDVFHFALAWDANRRASVEKASLVMYIDGEPIYGTDKTWIGVRESGNRIGFGGELSQRFAATPFNSTALTFSPVPTLPTDATASSWAAIENLKIYNYAKFDFSDRFDADLQRTQLVTPSELIQISLNNVDFEAVGSANLPLVTKGIADNESVTMYVRSDIPRDLTGSESRDASVLVRWKTPLQECE